MMATFWSIKAMSGRLDIFDELKRTPLKPALRTSFLTLNSKEVPLPLLARMTLETITFLELGGLILFVLETQQ